MRLINAFGIKLACHCCMLQVPRSITRSNMIAHSETEPFNSSVVLNRLCRKTTNRVPLPSHRNLLLIRI
jgi:hypothetical protein